MTLNLNTFYYSPYTTSSSVFPALDIATPPTTTDLFRALNDGDPMRFMTLLRRRDIDITGRDARGNTLLHVAAEMGNSTAVNALLSHPDGDRLLEARGQYGTPLMVAAANGHEHVVNDLLTPYVGHAGANVNAVDDNGWTALMHAAGEGHVHVIRQLHQHGAQMEIADEAGQTALLIATAESRHNAVQELIGLGANLNAQDTEGYTALVHAVIANMAPTIIALREAGADLELTDDNGATVLLLAAQGANVGLINALLQPVANMATPNLQARDNVGRTALILAAEEGHQDAVTIFLDHGISPDAQDHRGRTALMAAAQRGYPEILHALILAGANLHLTDYSLRNALDLAVQANRQTSANLLRPLMVFPAQDVPGRPSLRS